MYNTGRNARPMPCAGVRLSDGARAANLHVPNSDRPYAICRHAPPGAGPGRLPFVVSGGLRRLLSFVLVSSFWLLLCRLGGREIHAELCASQALYA